MSHRQLFLLAFLGFALATASAQSAAAPAQSAKPEQPTEPEQPVPSSFHRFTFNLGGGIGIGRADVSRFVGDSYHGVAGGGINFSRMFGMNAEYMYYDLPFKQSVVQQQFLLPGAGGRVQAALLNGIVNVPLHGHFGVYGIFGGGFYRRSVSNRKEPLLAGTPCQPAWRWWDLTCTTSGGVPVLAFDQTISSNTKDAGGFNAGVGATYRLNHFHHIKIYAEGRYHRAYHSDGQTTFLPITVGLRW